MAASEHEITEPNTLSVEFINLVSYKLLEYDRIVFLYFYGSKFVEK